MALSMFSHRLKFDTRASVMAVAFCSYIYDAIRNEFRESRRQDYGQYLDAKKCLDANPELLLEPAYFADTFPLLSDVLDHNQRLSRSVPTEETRLTTSDGNATGESNHIDCTQLQDDREDSVDQADKIFPCPLPAMPRYARWYQIVSTIINAYVALKYLFISLVQYGWIFIDPAYLCYLPGRLTYVRGLAYEFPRFIFLFAALQLVFRGLWYFKANRLDLDCFQFLCFDESTIIEKQNRLADLNSPRLAPIVSYRKYLSDKLFYQRYRTIDQKIRYKMRPNRTVEHWRKLRTVANAVPIVTYCNFTLVITPIMIIRFYNFLSHDLFSQCYPHCEFMSNRPINGTFRWSFEDPYRRVALIFDALELILFFPDVTFAIIVPACGMVLLTYDLILHFDIVINNLSTLVDKMTVIRDIRLEPGPDVIDLPRLIDTIKVEANKAYVDVIHVFEHVCKIDQFISILAPFCIFVWFLLNLTYQTVSILRKQTLISNSTIQYMQLVGVIVLTISFSVLVRPHNRTQKLYRKLCNAVAIDLDHQIGRNFCFRLLGFYNRNQSRFTLHILGKSYALSRINYFRSMSWFVTCTVLLLNLMQNKLNQ